jgi:hypothetical protein
VHDHVVDPTFVTVKTELPPSVTAPLFAIVKLIPAHLSLSTMVPAALLGVPSVAPLSGADKFMTNASSLSAVVSLTVVTLTGCEV